jgi:quercetin dioxygenase-like cupin family protein
MMLSWLAGAFPGGGSIMASMNELRDVRPRQIWKGVRARIIDGERMTLAIVEIGRGEQVPEHTHENEQMGFVIEGTVTFTAGDETRTLGPGGSWRIHANAPHRVTVGDEGAVVAECYTPLRSDWASLPLEDPCAPRWPAP